jgi:6-phosphogluconolactonase
MHKTVEIFKNTDELSDFFGHFILTGMQNMPEGQLYSLALSGGSTPKAVFAYLAANFKDQISWGKLCIFWSDERCVPPDSAESNYRMAKESLLDHVPIPTTQIFRMMGENDPAAEAERYEKVLQENIPGTGRMPAFDLLMLGLGDDGHTASIFPGNLAPFQSTKSVEVARHPQTKQQRITLTGTLINQAHTVAFLATGAGKAEKVVTVVEHQTGWEALPAAHVHPVDGNLLWLLDETAGQHLSNNSKV